MAIVLLDLDDTLNDLATGLSGALARRGIETQPSSWPTHAIHEHLGIPLDDFMQMIVDDHLLEDAPPAPGAHALVNAIVNAGHEAIVVTARGLHPLADAITPEWFRTHRMAVSDVIVVPYGKSKADVIPQLDAPIIGYLDDHAGHVEGMQRLVPPGRCLVLDKPWNAHATHLYRAKSLQEAALIFHQPMPPDRSVLDRRAHEVVLA